MTTIPSTPRSTAFTVPSASAGPFNVGFRLLESDALKVFVGGDPRTDFSVSATYVDGYTDAATITFTSPLLAGSSVQIDGATIPRRQADYLNGSPDLVKGLNIEFGRIWAAISEVGMQTGRSLRSFTASNPVNVIDLEAIANSEENANIAAAAAEAAALYSEPRFTTVAALEASTAPSLGAVGAIVNAGGYRYQIVTTGEHLTTAGGVKLIVMAGADGCSILAFSAIGDGTTDNSTVIQSAIDSGENLRFPRGRYAAKNLTFSASDATYTFDGGAALVFNGSTADRLYTVSGDNVSFIDAVFDGDGAQPALSLGYVATGVDRFVLRGGRTHNVAGTSSGSNLVNNCYGLGISPDAVSNFLIDGHNFENITKDNTGTFFPRTEGVGFCGGIILTLPTATDPVAPYSWKSSGVITNCVFDNIQTIRASGLPAADYIKYDDGDGIRLYGNEVHTSDSDITISNCIFRDCSKRAVKSAIRGVKVYDIFVETTSASPYPMSSLVKMHNDNVLRGVVGKMGSSAKEVGSAIQVAILNATNNYTILENVTVDYCAVLGEIIGLGSASLDGVRFSNFNCPNVSLRAFSEAADAATTNKTMLERWTVAARGAAVQFAVTATDGLTYRSIRATNMSFKASESKFYVDDVDVVITNPAFTGGAGVAPLEIGGGSNWRCGRVSLDVTALGAGVFLNSQNYVAIITGTGSSTIGEIYLKTADNANNTYSHLNINGTDMTIGKLVYDGPGSIDLGVFVGSVRVSVDTVIRRGATSTTTYCVFIGQAGTSRISIDAVHDMRVTTQPSVRLLSGSSATVVRSVTSLTSAGSATQDDTGGQLTVTTATKI